MLNRWTICALAVVLSQVPASATSLGPETVWSLPVQGSFYSLESSRVTADGGFSLFSGYVDTWYMPAGTPNYAQALSNADPAIPVYVWGAAFGENSLAGSYLPSGNDLGFGNDLGVSLGYAPGAVSAVESSFFSQGQILSQPPAALSSAIETSAATLQADPAGDVTHISAVPEPRAATLVLLGCCIVALSLALANRKGKDQGELADDLPGKDPWRTF